MFRVVLIFLKLKLKEIGEMLLLPASVILTVSIGLTIFFIVTHLVGLLIAKLCGFNPPFTLDPFYSLGDHFGRQNLSPIDLGITFFGLLSSLFIIGVIIVIVIKSVIFDLPWWIKKNWRKARRIAKEKENGK
jgi:hypothetical protein